MKDSLERVMVDFVEYCELEKGLSPRTAQKYHYRLMRFLNWLRKEHQGKEPSLRDVNDETIKRFRLYLHRFESELTKKELASSTQQHYLVALRAFLRYLKKKRAFDGMAAEDITLPKAGGHKVTFLNEEQLARLFKQPDVRTIAGLRDRAILELFFSTGLRVQELVNLNRDQIPKKEHEFSVLGKGNRYRVVFLSEDAKSWINLYLSRRLDTWEPLFLNNRGLKLSSKGFTEPNKSPKRSKGSRSHEKNVDDLDDLTVEKFRLTVRSIQRMIKKYAHAAGLSVDVTPHVLRHSFATDLLISGADLRSVQELLGHKNVATTQIYTHVTNQQLRKVYERFHSKISEDT